VPTVVMMQNKKTARASAENDGDKTGPYIKERLIGAGYTYPEQCIDELLELAGADAGPESRTDLLNALQLAQMAWEDEEATPPQRPPSRQVDQFERSIETTLKLLRGIREYEAGRNVGFVTQPVGRGVIEVATMQEIMRGRELQLPQHSSISDGELILPTVGMGEMVAKANVEPLLRATLLFTRRTRRGRGGRKKLGKESVVLYAEDYFRKHSPKEPSTDPANPFHTFLERFYEVVTKTKPSGFDRQMRKIFRANRSGH
jgi:hypothetical protein